nr:MAG TPA: hypothetical protein [Caudoviricetes sp.]
MTDEAARRAGIDQPVRNPPAIGSVLFPLWQLRLCARDEAKPFNF